MRPASDVLPPSGATKEGVSKLPVEGDLCKVDARLLDAGEGKGARSARHREIDSVFSQKIALCPAVAKPLHQRGVGVAVGVAYDDGVHRRPRRSIASIAAHRRSTDSRPSCASAASATGIKCYSLHVARPTPLWVAATRPAAVKTLPDATCRRRARKRYGHAAPPCPFCLFIVSSDRNARLNGISSFSTACLRPPDAPALSRSPGREHQTPCSLLPRRFRDLQAAPVAMHDGLPQAPGCQYARPTRRLRSPPHRIYDTVAEAAGRGEVPRRH